MTFKAAKCPNCAGDLQVPEDRDTVKCMYCGSDIIVREAIKLAGGVNIENLLMLAKKSEDAGASKEAYKYYSTVLEYDPNNVDAWVGKGFTAESIEFSQKCFRTAVDITPDPDKEKFINVLSDRVAEKFFSHCSVSYDSNDKPFGTLSKQPFLDKLAAINFIDPDTDNPDVLAYRYAKEGIELLRGGGNVWDFMCGEGVKGAINNFKMARSKSNHPVIMKYISSHIRDKLHEFIDEFKFDSEKVHEGKEEQVLDSCRIPFPPGIFKEFDPVSVIKNLKMLYDYFLTFNEPLTYTYKSSSGYVLKCSLEEVHKVILSIQKYWVLKINRTYSSYHKDAYYIKLRDYLIKEIRKSEPGYKPPAVRKCFIATAAYGSPMAHEVILLRGYRDSYLTNTFLGRAFVKAYYLFSPPIARVISKSEFLKAITRLILKPVISLVKRYYWNCLITSRQE